MRVLLGMMLCMLWAVALAAQENGAEQDMLSPVEDVAEEAAPAQESLAASSEQQLDAHDETLPIRLRVLLRVHPLETQKERYYPAEIIYVNPADRGRGLEQGQDIFLIHSVPLRSGVFYHMQIESVLPTQGIWRVDQAGQDAQETAFTNTAQRFEHALAEHLLQGQVPQEAPVESALISAVLIGRLDSQMLIEYLGPLHEGPIQWQTRSTIGRHHAIVEAVDGRFAILRSDAGRALAVGQILRLSPSEEQ